MSWWEVAAAAYSLYSTSRSSKANNEAYENQKRAAAAEAAYNIRAAEREIGSIQRALQLDELRGEDLRSAIEFARREGYLAAERATHVEKSADFHRARADLTDKQANLYERKADDLDRRIELTADQAGLHRDRSALAMFAARTATEGGKTALFNAQVQETLADDAIRRGEITAETIRLKEEAQIGADKARAAVRGVQVGSGSAADITASTEYLSAREQTVARNEAERQAFLSRVQGYNYRASIASHVEKALGAKHSSKQAALDADKSEQTARELTTNQYGLRLSAEGARATAEEQRHSALGAELSAEGLRNRAIGFELKAQQGITTEADRLRKRADAMQKQDQLREKQELFALQGIYGQRALALQNKADQITALGDTVVGVGTLVDSITRATGEKH